MLLERTGPGGVTRLVIDTSPDLREQMLSAGVPALDAVWYTHEHADHTHGIDELRGFFLRQKHRIPIWADAVTAGMLTARFAYCFQPLPGSDYPPILALNGLDAGVEVTAHGAGGPISGTPFQVQHGHIHALGFRWGNVAYTPDVNGIPDGSVHHLEGLDLWIVDALRRERHVSHFSLPETLEWIEKLKPKRAILTNLHNDLDYETLTRELPEHIIPAYDGMRISI